MNGAVITRILKSDQCVGPIYAGTFPSDKLPKGVQPVPIAMVMNTDPQGQPGEHWTAIYVDKDGFGVYFDSLGRPPSTVNAFEQFLLINSRSWIYNDRMVQNPFLSTCGQYCIYFLTKICRGYTLRDVIDSLDGFDDNDQAVVDYVQDNYDVHTRTFDEDFVWTQISRALK